MNLMAELWTQANPPTLTARLEVVSSFAAIVRNLGPANFIYSDSEILFVHGHQCTTTGHKDTLSAGLFILCRTCSPTKEKLKIEGMNVSLEHNQQKVLLVATIPLTNENWIPLAEGEIHAIARGQVLASIKQKETPVY